jgi:hypothetical protein
MIRGGDMITKKYENFKNKNIEMQIKLFMIVVIQ